MVSTLALLLRGVALIVLKPSEEDILHCFGVIGAPTSQPDPNQTYQNLQDLTAQEILQIVRYKKPQRQIFALHFKPIFPKNSSHHMFQNYPSKMCHD